MEVQTRVARKGGQLTDSGVFFLLQQFLRLRDLIILIK